MEDTESADTGRVSGRPRKEKESESHRCFGSRVFIEDCGLMYMSSHASRNWIKQVLSCPLEVT